ncbi:hypothetical protein ABT096_29725 [Streptomyces sp. NPDC002561]|uniref:hypothetical protein n=1 Tax=Streptomyces sp. NPDC002561 TaxID=3154418 RepID=UPI003334987E
MSTERQSASVSAASAALAVALITLPARAWLLMLVVGALHGLTAAVPAIGYGTTLLLTIGLDFVVGTARRILHK